MPCLKFKDVIKILENEGFERVRVRGSHGHFKAEIDGEIKLVTCQVDKPNADVKKGTLGSIVRQSGLSKKLFK